MFTGGSIILRFGELLDRPVQREFDEHDAQREERLVADPLAPRFFGIRPPRRRGTNDRRADRTRDGRLPRSEFPRDVRLDRGVRRLCCCFRGRFRHELDVVFVPRFVEPRRRVELKDRRSQGECEPDSGGQGEFSVAGGLGSSGEVGGGREDLGEGDGYPWPGGGFFAVGHAV